MTLFELILTPKDPKAENLFLYAIALDLHRAIKIVEFPAGYVLEQVKAVAMAGNGLFL